MQSGLPSSRRRRRRCWRRGRRWRQGRAWPSQAATWRSRGVGVDSRVSLDDVEMDFGVVKGFFLYKSNPHENYGGLWKASRCRVWSQRCRQRCRRWSQPPWQISCPTKGDRLTPKKEVGGLYNLLFPSLACWQAGLPCIFLQNYFLLKILHGWYHA